MNIPNIKHIKDQALAEQLKALRVKESEAISDLVLHLSELDNRGYYRDLGYSSLFSYMTKGLGYSEGAAQRRIQAARCLIDYPEVYFKLRAGTLSLCSVSEIVKAPVGKRAHLLTASEGKSKREVEQLVAVTLPAVPSKRETVRVKHVKVFPPPATPLFSGTASEITEERYTLTLEVGKEFMQLLEQSKAITGGGKSSEVIEKALKNFVKVKAPRIRVARKSKVASKESRRASKTLRDKILIRDGCQCSYVSPTGLRCGERIGLEIDHCKPYALGGQTEENNLRTLCRAHNQLMAERTFGRKKMQSYRREQAK